MVYYVLGNNSGEAKPKISFPFFVGSPHPPPRKRNMEYGVRIWGQSPYPATINSICRTQPVTSKACTKSRKLEIVQSVEKGTRYHKRPKASFQMVHRNSWRLSSVHKRSTNGIRIRRRTSWCHQKQTLWRY